MTRPIAVFFLILLPLFLAGCFENANEKANKIYVNASMQMEKELREADSYDKVLNVYKKADESITQILSKYKTTDIAVNLLSGQAKLAGMSVEDFRKKKTILGRLHDANNDLLSYASLISDHLDRDWRVIYRERVLSALARLGKYDQMFSEAEKYEEKGLRETAMFKLALKKAGLGELQEALDKAKEITDDEMRDSALLYIEVNQRKKNSQDGSLRLISGYLEKYKENYSDGRKAWFFKKYIDFFVDSGDRESAINLLERLAEIKVSDESDYYETIGRLSYIASRYIFLGNNDVAHQFLSQANEIIQTAKQSHLNFIAVPPVAIGYAQAGQLEKAISLAESISSQFFKERTLIDVATNYTKPIEAEHLVLNAIGTSKSMDKDEYSRVLVDATSYYLAAKKNDKASKSLELARRAVDKIYESPKREELLVEVAKLYEKLGDQENFGKVLSRALEGVDSSWEDKDRIDVLISIADTGYTLNNDDKRWLKRRVRELYPVENFKI